MRSIRVVLHFAEDALHPMHAHVCEAPYVEREAILQGYAPGDTGTMVLYVEGDADAYEDWLASVPHLESYNVSPADEAGFFVFLQERLDADDPLVVAFQREDLIVVPPVEFRSDRTIRMSLVGGPGDLQAALDALPRGVTPDVKFVGDFTTSVGDRLTERQCEAVDAAWDVGYYELPREAGIETVAAELNCAISTASELLRRAESRLVADALDRSR